MKWSRDHVLTWDYMRATLILTVNFDSFTQG
jgi:hypothetical protein